MAGSARYTAVLDANVLYPAPVRDLLLSLAHAGLYQARWTRRIQDEWTRGLLKSRPELADRLPRIVERMNAAIPDCLVEGYEMLVATLELPDPDDRHVLAAAIVGHADALVTFNLKDFPVAALDRFRIEPRHPNEFVLDQLELSPYDALVAVKRMRARLRNPPKSARELIDLLERCGLPASAVHLRGALELI